MNYGYGSRDRHVPQVLAYFRWQSKLKGATGTFRIDERGFGLLRAHDGGYRTACVDMLREGW